MPNIENEIDQIAEDLAKSNQDPKEKLFDTIRHLGSDGIKAKLDSLNKSEKELLQSALEEMSKGGPGSGQKGHMTSRVAQRQAKLTAINAGVAAHAHEVAAVKDKEQRHEANKTEADHAKMRSKQRAKEKMDKAVEMDKNYAAKYVQGKIDDTIIQEDKADDDQDEKLVSKEPEAQTVNHQGTPTPGWEGQVIKGKEMSKDQAKDKIMDMEIKEHKTKDPKKLVEAEKEEHAKKCMKKSIEILQSHGATFLAMFPDEIEKAHVGFKKVSENAAKHGAEDPDAVAAAVGRKKYGKAEFQHMADAGKKHVKKSEDDMVCSKKKEMPFGDLKDEKKSKDEKKEALKKIKKSVEDQLKEKGVVATPELVKSEMKRLLKEEDQDGDAPEMNEKTRTNKENVASLDMGKDNKEAQKKVNDEKQGMKKALWGNENDLLKANTNGRNHHFSMDDYIDQVLAESTKPAEDVKKSNSESKEDLNDIIAKGGDASWDQINCDRLVKANNDKIKGKFVKSFEPNEIAEALGLTEEEAKKILGE